MYEDAQEILEYLPLEAGIEAPYILHLWRAFESLVKSGDPAMPFAIMPYHLLFMFAIQYRVYRVSAWDNVGYLRELPGCHTFGGNATHALLRTNAPIVTPSGILAAGSSVRNLSLLHEQHLFRLLKPIGIELATTARAEALVARRGQYAHANGNVEQDLELQIAEYLSVLAEIQPKMLPLNDRIATDWHAEILPEDTIIDFLQPRLGAAFLCAQDFKSGQLAGLYSQALQDAGII